MDFGLRSRFSNLCLDLGATGQAHKLLTNPLDIGPVNLRRTYPLARDSSSNQINQSLQIAGSFFHSYVPTPLSLKRIAWNYRQGISQALTYYLEFLVHTTKFPAGYGENNALEASVIEFFTEIEKSIKLQAKLVELVSFNFIMMFHRRGRLTRVIQLSAAASREDSCSCRVGLRCKAP